MQIVAYTTPDIFDNVNKSLKPILRQLWQIILIIITLFTPLTSRYLNKNIIQRLFIKLSLASVNNIFNRGEEGDLEW